MATEDLIVILDAKTQKLDEALKASNERLDNLEGSTRKADTSLANMAKTAIGAGAKIATAALAAASAISAIVIASAKSVKELEILASQAKLTTSDFNSLAFATKQYGVDAEQVADISKDLADKLGEFSAAGTGAFQDFADVVGLSKEEAIALANEFQDMSSDQVLGQMVSMMENAGASSNQMTFAMESMGNEASRLIPLFANQSQELNELRSGYDKINTSMQLTKEQQDALTQTATDWDLLTTAMGNSANAISATLAPTLSTFINDVIEIVPEATQAIIDFLNSFKDAANINSIEAIDRQIADLNKELDELPEKAKKAAIAGSGLYSSFELQTAIGNDPTADAKAAINKRIEDLQMQRSALEEEATKLADADKRLGGVISGNGEGENVFNGIPSQTDDKKLKEIKKSAKEEVKIFQDKERAKLDAQSNYVSAAKSLTGAFLEDSKSVNAGLIVADTAVGVQRALTPVVPGAPPNIPAALMIAASGVAQLANNASASKGGGSISGGGVSSTSAQPTQQSESTTVSVSDTSTGEQQTMRVELGIEGLDTLVEGIVKKTRQMEIDGELT